MLFRSLVFHWGVKGAAGATVFSQYVSGVGIMIYYYVKFPHLRVNKCHMKWDTSILKEITGLSVLTCMQQSIMNLGILMVQGLVNSFGTAVMAAFAAAVKIDSFAYMPVQDFGNAFSTFVAQNYGAGKKDRIRQGTASAVKLSCVFCFVVSALVFIFAQLSYSVRGPSSGTEKCRNDLMVSATLQTASFTFPMQDLIPFTIPITKSLPQVKACEASPVM